MVLILPLALLVIVLVLWMLFYYFVVAPRLVPAQSPAVLESALPRDLTKPTDLRTVSSDPEGSISAAGSASTHTDTTGTGHTSATMAFQPGAGSGGRPSEPRGNQDKDMKDLFDRFATTDDGRPSILTLPQPFTFTLRDAKQKIVRLQSKNLVAEASNSDPEKLSVVPNRFVQGKQNPIILGVQEGKSCLSCGTSAEPKLQLEDKNIMDLFVDQEQAARFTFHNIPEGSTHRFESAAYPGWFLCTSQKSSEPISITNRTGETEITEFYFKRILT